MVQVVVGVGVGVGVEVEVVVGVGVTKQGFNVAVGVGVLDIVGVGVLLSMSSKRLLIDSSVMHIATALNLPSVVTWVGTNPKVFGFDIHTNIISNEPTKKPNLNHPHYFKYLLFQDISSIPYNDLYEVFDIQKIVDDIDQQ